VAIVPKETELGRKRAVDTAVCNSDLSCNKGFCPSFLTIAGRRRPSTAISASASASASITRSPPKPDPQSLLAEFQVPPPPSRVSLSGGGGRGGGGGERANILVCGIGGTGVVTLGAVLSRAAAAAGLHVNVFDQVGLSQKNGSVVSHIKISSQPIFAPRVGPGQATAVLAADIVTAVAPHNLAVISAPSAPSAPSAACAAVSGSAEAVEGGGGGVGGCRGGGGRHTSGGEFARDTAWLICAGARSVCAA